MHYFLTRCAMFKIADTLNEHEDIADILDHNVQVIQTASQSTHQSDTHYLKQFTRAAAAPVMLSHRQQSSLPDILEKSVEFWKVLRSESLTPSGDRQETLDTLNRNVPAVLITNLIASRFYCDSISSPTITEIDHVMPLLGWQDTWPPLSRIATDPSISNEEINAIYTELSCFEERMAHPYKNSSLIHTPLANSTTPQPPLQYLQ